MRRSHVPRVSILVLVALSASGVLLAPTAPVQANLSGDACSDYQHPGYSGQAGWQPAGMFDLCVEGPGFCYDCVAWDPSTSNACGFTVRRISTNKRATASIMKTGRTSPSPVGVEVTGPRSVRCNSSPQLASLF